MSEEEQNLGAGEEGDIPPGLRNFTDKLMGRFHERFLKENRGVRSVASDGLVLGLIGATWAIVRENSEVFTIEDAVGRIRRVGHFEIDTDDLILFEGGWIDPQDYKEGLIEAIGRAYGWQELAKEQIKFFDLARNRTRKPPTS